MVYSVDHRPAALSGLVAFCLESPDRLIHWAVPALYSAATAFFLIGLSALFNFLELGSFFNLLELASFNFRVLFSFFSLFKPRELASLPELLSRRVFSLLYSSILVGRAPVDPRRCMRTFFFSVVSTRSAEAGADPAIEARRLRRGLSPPPVAPSSDLLRRTRRSPVSSASLGFFFTTLFSIGLRPGIGGAC